MLVGTTNIDTNELSKHCNSAEDLIAYSDSLVPSYFRGVREIVNNQRYYTAVILRNFYKNDYNKWHPLCNALLTGVRVVGSLTDIYTCKDLLQECDAHMIYKFLDKTD